MANTKAAKKAIRSSARKKQHNLFWKSRVKKATKSLEKVLKEEGAKIKKTDLQAQLSNLQSILDKSAKEKVIHKNKANRLKSRFAKKLV